MNISTRRLAPWRLLLASLAVVVAVAGTVPAYGQAGEGELPPEVAELLAKVPTPPDEDEASRVPLRVTVEEGTLPSEREVEVFSVTMRPDMSLASGNGGNLAIYRTIRLSSDRITRLLIVADGYVPAVVGPLQIDADHPAPASIDVELKRGFTGRVRVIDPDGKPVARATLRGGYLFGDAASDWIDEDRTFARYARVESYGTDAHGIAELPHATASPYGFVVDTPGYERRREVVTPTPDGVVTLTAVPAAKTTGRIFESHGEPAGGTTIRLLGEDRSQDDTLFKRRPDDTPVLAEADEFGRFELDTLERGRMYVLLLEHPDFGRKVIHPFEGGTPRVEWEIGPPMVLRGEVEGDLEPPMDPAQPPTVWVSTSLPQIASLFRLSGGGGQVPVPVDRHGHFEYPLMQPVMSVQVFEDPNAIVSLMATQPVETVKLRLPEEGAAEEAEGTEQEDSGASAMPLRAGPGARGAAGARGVVAMLLATAWAVQGEAVDEEEPAESDKAAGAVLVRVVDAGGSPVQGGYLSLRLADEPEDESERNRLYALLPNLDFVEQTFKDTVAIHPIPTGLRCRVRVRRGNTIVLSQPFELTPERLTRELTVTMPRGVTAKVRAVDDQGRPVRNVRVSWTSDGREVGGSGRYTDRDGRCRIDGLNPEAGEYAATLEPWRDFQEATVPLRLDGRESMATLERGLVIEGRAVDEAGEPMAGVETWGWRPTPAKGAWVQEFYAEAPTDEQGRFRISTLPAGRFTIIGRRGQPPEVRQANEDSEEDGMRPVADAGQPQPVTVLMEKAEEHGSP